MTLKELLLSLRKEELYSFAKDELNLRRISKFSKEELVKVIETYMLIPDKMKNILYGLNSDCLKLLNRLCKENVPCSQLKFDIANKLALTFYVSYEDGKMVIPDDVKKVFMSIYKEPYITEHRKINWILQCLKFASHFYGIIPTEILFKLLRKNSYFKETKEEIIAILEKIHFRLFKCYYNPKDDYFYESNLDDERWNRLAEEQDGKPFYIPTKKEIEDFYLCDYLDSYSYQKFFDLMEYDEVKSLIMKKILYKEISLNENEKELLEAILNVVEFENKEHAELVVQAYTELVNDTRMVYNRGYKPKELVDSSLIDKLNKIRY